MEAVKNGLVEENGALRGEMARLKAELDSQVHDFLTRMQNTGTKLTQSVAIKLGF
jgi:hypothetical protein